MHRVEDDHAADTEEVMCAERDLSQGQGRARMRHELWFSRAVLTQQLTESRLSWSVTTVTFGRLLKSSTLMTARPALLIDVRLAVVAALWFSQFTAPGERGIRVSQVARRDFV